MDHPNILLLLTDQLRYPPSYESRELADYRRRQMPGQTRLTESGVFIRAPLPDGHGLRSEQGVAADGPVPVAARGHADRRAREERRQPRHVLARPGHRPHHGRLVPRRRLPDLLQGQVARLPRPSRRPRRRGVSAVDRRRRQANPREHRRVPAGGSARRLRILGVGAGPSRAASASTTRAPSRTRSRPTRPSSFSAGLDAEDGGDPWLAGLLVPEPSRRLPVRRREPCRRGFATTRRGCRTSSSRRHATRTSPRSPCATRAWSICGRGSAPRSRGSRRT